jgi:hypothetical protein
MLMLSFSYFTVEVVVADVHDGDAPASEIAKLAGDASGTPTVPDAPLDGPTHDIHVCHCAHPHGGLTARPLILSPARSIPVVNPTLDVLAPGAVDLDHHLRPPIA